MADQKIDSEVLELYKELIESWNKRDAKGMANCFVVEGNVIGFDGSQMNGRKEIETTLSEIFAQHQTAPYVTKIREVRLLADTVALLRAAAGMVMPGESDINPEVNAIQTLVAVKADSGWRAALFQNTPAAFHGRPELAKSLTEELRAVLRSTK